MAYRSDVQRKVKGSLGVLRPSSCSLGLGDYFWFGGIGRFAKCYYEKAILNKSVITVNKNNPVVKVKVIFISLQHQGVIKPEA